MLLPCSQGYPLDFPPGQLLFSNWRCKSAGFLRPLKEELLDGHGHQILLLYILIKIKVSKCIYKPVLTVLHGGKRLNDVPWRRGTFIQPLRTAPPLPRASLKIYGLDLAMEAHSVLLGRLKPPPPPPHPDFNCLDVPLYQFICCFCNFLSQIVTRERLLRH